MLSSGKGTPTHARRPSTLDFCVVASSSTDDTGWILRGALLLTAEQNERLTQIGPGTPMGTLLRRYWHPVATEFEMNNEPTKRVRILGESLTLYLNKSGNYGLIGERCPHRLVNLAAGIVEPNGLRCMYHGWMFNAEGECIEQPAEPQGSAFKDKVRITAYPVEVLGGLIWAYLGPNPRPLLPRWDLFVKEGVFRQIGCTVLPANWVQCQENSADSWHAHFTHGWYATYLIERFESKGMPVTDEMRRIAAGFKNNPDMKHSYERHRFGLLKRRLRVHDSEDVHGWRVGHPIVFPNYVRIGKKGWSTFQMRVPLDDTHTWHLDYEVIDPGPDVEVPNQDIIPAYDVPLMDLPNFILGQDYVAWSEQGEIADRTQEMLGSSDEGVIMFRKLLAEQIDVVLEGGDPINTVRDPAKNECITIEAEDYGTFEDYVDNAFAYYDTSPHGFVDEVEDLFQKAKSAAIQKKG